MVKLSIITINLNNKLGLIKTIESVISQTLLDYEFIIIDGASTDGSVDVLKKQTKNIHYWTSEPDAGIYNAMNKGILKAKGEYCLFLNSGDYLVKDVLRNVFYNQFTQDIIYFNSYLSYASGIVKELKYPSNLSFRYFYSATIGHQATFIKKNLFDKFGNYSEHYQIHSDYEFWIKSIIIGNSSIHHCHEFLTYYDMNGLSSRSNSVSTKEHTSILHTLIPERIMIDYTFWFNQEKSIEILQWYKRQKYLYFKS